MINFRCKVVKNLQYFLIISSFLNVNFAFQKNCTLNRIRLPKRIQPNHYDLYLDLDSNMNTFNGKVDINLEVKTKQFDSMTNNKNNLTKLLIGDKLHENEIILHSSPSSLSFDLHNVFFTSHANKQKHIKVLDLCSDPENEMILIRLAENLDENPYGILHIDFSGKMQSNMEGLFKTQRVSHNKTVNTQLNYTATQLESTNARSVFPCFDEPEFKATFRLILKHSSDEVALSNSELVSSDKDPNDAKKTVSRFAETVPMSSYLFAITVGLFDHIEGFTRDNKQRVRFYTTPGLIDYAKLPLEIAISSLEAVKEYLNVDFPMGKIDIVSLKQYPGAMENYGLIIGNEVQLLTKAITSTYNGYITMVSVIHEIAHQWFGNLVTMKWWDDVWLNEGFATWMSYYIGNIIIPSVKFKESYIFDRKTEALENDLSVEINSIRRKNINSKAEIDSLFDELTYEKGAAIIYWLQFYIGEDLFRDGLREYIGKYKDANTQISDLATVLERISKLPVVTFLNSWLNQAGHPLVSIDYEHETNELKLIQQINKSYRNSFLYCASNSIDCSGIWFIPSMILISDGEERNEIIKFTMKSENLVIKLPSWFDLSNGKHWLKMNVDSVGFYRVNYSKTILKAMKIAINSRKMSLIDRVNILDDILSLSAHKNQLSIPVDEILNWFSSKDDLYTLNKIIFYKDYFQDQPKVLKILQEKSSKFYRKYAFIDEYSNDLLKQAYKINILSYVALENLSSSANKFLEYFDKFGSNGAEYLKLPVCLAVASYGNLKQYEKLLKIEYDDIFAPDFILLCLHKLKNQDKFKQAQSLFEQFGVLWLT